MPGADDYTVDSRWDDDDIIDYLRGEYSPSDEIASGYYRPAEPDGEPSEKPYQERCERYDGPFAEDGPDCLRSAAGVLVYISYVFDPIDDEDLEDVGPVIDAEDRSLEIYTDVKGLESAWSRTRRTYEEGQVTR